MIFSVCVCVCVCGGGGGSGPPVPPLDPSMVNIYDTHTRRSAVGPFDFVMCLCDSVFVLVHGDKIHLLVCYAEYFDCLHNNAI